MGQDPSIENIKDVTEVNGSIFIATENGIYYEFSDEWLSSDFTSNSNYLIGNDSNDSYSLLVFGDDDIIYNLAYYY